MSLKVAHISYLNSVPFYAGMESPHFELLDMHPRALGQAAAEHAIDAGLMSVADTFRNEEFEPLGDLGIGLDGPAHSVLLFSARPVERLDGSIIGVTGETSTSYPLLRLVLEDPYGVHPARYVRRLRGPERGDDGMLLIGDAALRRAARGGLEPHVQDYAGGRLQLASGDPFGDPFRHVLDLAAAWRRWQQRPFVFARWMVARDVPRPGRVMLLELLIETLETNLRRLDRLAAEHAERVGMSPEGAFAYLMGFTYRFGTAGERGIERFRKLLEASEWWEAAPPVLETEGT